MLVDPEREPVSGGGVTKLDASAAVLVALEIGEAVVELRVPDWSRLAKVELVAIDRSRACRDPALVGPQHRPPGARRTTESTVGVPIVRYGWVPAPYGQARSPTFVAVVCTRRPAAVSRYSMPSASENG